ncbi:pyridoxamine 5'-phosphate oxidase [Nocardioides daeguensis]|uniref:Pyridoxine/pyridoxamine 5'-phosphate oxidase n=1 Tax=Nocardioides daeguensis TaxID=908359 RepID=A0ABP6V275_9ACTN|nr:pyridoxamine 5'-phosphate oxidase [Nocardioides daeguensis]MBV6727118.1 pyridoxamine 5'-phosphate oxidase [Nocardioides daeguensis]MCR1771479.1 pyridoxamine 5'-phosphate oxidase [Nocardioides daeguensis]
MASDLTAHPDLAALRREYGEIGLVEADAPPGPWPLWQHWFEEISAAGVHEPNAMVVATVDPDGSPSARMVLLKGVTTDGPDDGFTFFTNTASRKGAALASEPRCSLLFPWHPLERQVRVEGTAHLLGEEQVAAYFAARPRGAQVGAWASPQSQVVDGRAELDRRYREAEERFADGEVPVPPGWGGYRVQPASFEFWQGRAGRMHDRLRYARTSSGWELTRLAP